ncbi:MAG TPA: winged helix-turn-helix domain-containing protein [Methanomassiliicoccales archaeon]|jgi:predicted transcriptional regulator|nr:winged helix-turn-helix domain-containing protein [Euryarchaeota archaeon]HOO03999.1 winged helix-turn-helix domain-containing protein [Methanomassiliicoccales archaeon]HRR67030.1 winged helix-turn-helix domain-containing protein [Methanomassiliicoccales archaeon]HRU12102.1 winged helix-turn-helix domain-containing protein [Methanomassiliicoccales archaeon]
MERPDLYVVARVLERLWREPSPILRTRLQVAVGTNYDVFSRYLDWMTERGLTALIEEDGHQKVVLTDGGREAYRRLVVWINEVVHGRR